MWSTFLLDQSIDFNTHLSHSSPSVWNGKVFAGRTYNKGGKMVALNTKNGKLIWQKIYSGRCLSDPSIAAKSGIVVFGCHDGNVYGLDCATGDEKWKFKTGGVVLSSPWIGDGVVYIASHDGFVYALN